MGCGRGQAATPATGAGQGRAPRSRSASIIPDLAPALPCGIGLEALQRYRPRRAIQQTAAYAARAAVERRPGRGAARSQSLAGAGGVTRPGAHFW